MLKRKQPDEYMEVLNVYEKLETVKIEKQQTKQQKTVYKTKCVKQEVCTIQDVSAV